MMRKMRAVVPRVAGLIALLLLPGTPLWSQATGTIRGTITGAAQQPVSNAQVGVVDGRAGTRTNAAGVFTLLAVPAGTQTLRVQMIGYAAATKQVTVVAGQTATVNFQLSEAVLTLNEIVITGTGGEQTRRSQPA